MEWLFWSKWVLSKSFDRERRMVELQQACNIRRTESKAEIYGLDHNSHTTFNVSRAGAL